MGKATRKIHTGRPDYEYHVLTENITDHLCCSYREDETCRLVTKFVTVLVVFAPFFAKKLGFSGDRSEIARRDDEVDLVVLFRTVVLPIN
jgi:hypothetical protein